ncbi:hypothetical protein FA10DRAFT_266457 [Acaromyces ingoldii]|uniref:Uncharacterized protein n=1 Tax=Acaromyces ingoldii TaxID=215250 RepID=A0A316YK41_9BASI|nr:hypothetical protein FA10DRAFT_266457 [Acaromyces ingoldii]PWN89920.1 hypothetical protein FA10DRAFT_266457 [Acaromyces ingoldii]
MDLVLGDDAAAAVGPLRWHQHMQPGLDRSRHALSNHMDYGEELLRKRASLPSSFFTSTSLPSVGDVEALFTNDEVLPQEANEPPLWLSTFEEHLISSQLRTVFSQIRSGQHDVVSLARTLVAKLESSPRASSASEEQVQDAQKHEEAQLLILSRWAVTTLATLDSSSPEIALSPSSVAHHGVTMRLYESSIASGNLLTTGIPRTLISRQRAVLHRLFGLFLSWSPPSLPPSWGVRQEYTRLKLLYRSLASSAKVLADPRLKRSQVRYLFRKLLARISREASFFRRQKPTISTHRDKELDRLRKQVWADVGRTLAACVDEGIVPVVTDRKGERALHNVVRRGAELETFLTLSADARMGSICLAVARHAQLAAHRDEQAKARTTHRQQAIVDGQQEEDFDSRSQSRLSKHSSSLSLRSTLPKNLSIRRYHYAGREVHQAFGDETCLQRVVDSLARRGQGAVAKKLAFMAPVEQRTPGVLQSLMRHWGENVMVSVEMGDQMQVAELRQPVSNALAERKGRSRTNIKEAVEVASSTIYQELLRTKGLDFDRETMEARMASHRNHRNPFLVFDDLRRRHLASRAKDAADGTEDGQQALEEGMLKVLLGLSDAAQIHAVETYARAGRVRHAIKLGRRLIDARMQASVGRQRQLYFQTRVLNLVVRAILFGGARDPAVQSRLVGIRRRRQSRTAALMDGDALKLRAKQLRRIRRRGRTPMENRIVSALATIRTFGWPNAQTTTLLVNALCRVSPAKLSDAALVHALEVSFDWTARGAEHVCTDLAALLDGARCGAEAFDRAASRRAILLMAKARRQHALLARHCRLVQRFLLRRRNRPLATHAALIADELDRGALA